MKCCSTGEIEEVHVMYILKIEKLHRENVHTWCGVYLLGTVCASCKHTDEIRKNREFFFFFKLTFCCE